MARENKFLEDRLKNARKFIEEDDDVDEDRQKEEHHYVPVAVSDEGITLLEQSKLWKPAELNKIRMIQSLERLLASRDNLMKDLEADRIGEVHRLFNIDRRRLYAYWVNKYLAGKVSELSLNCFIN